MNYRADESPKLDLKLNLSPPRNQADVVSPPQAGHVSSTEISPRSSCVSREPSSPDDEIILGFSSSPPETSSANSMMLVGCPRCLMYVMLSADDPKCPQCKSTVLLDFMHDDRNKMIMMKKK